MSSPFQLTLGLDMRPQTTGATQYALWLCRAANLQPAGHVHAVHVIDPPAMVELSRHVDEQTMLGAFKRRGKEILDEIAHGARLHAPEVRGGDVLDELEAAAREQSSTALLVSRRAGAGARLALTRLGSTARRLLRRLAQPTIVVPPDLLCSSVGDGPVLVAVDFSEDSARALAWARSVATVIGRKLELVHFAEMPDQLGYAGLIQSERWDQLANEILDSARGSMVAFVRNHRAADLRTTVLRGSTLPALPDYAASRHACLLVTGSGHHGLAHRAIVPSVASETAALSSVPVAVVP
ncbi:universal stress protein [Enhygromyxa salina]|uniref:Universal stress protein family protein n=1 Tax=Enhygromyxa salina TaxID=215803 RepID=A0A2S9YRS9_9BACT|nr:universal stress protein [Enhygromyxa salina]PRQ07804.1 Universal stress protein family protein [Enhygromyxa salina]